jgi:hypothetical protein
VGSGKEMREVERGGDERLGERDGMRGMRREIKERREG